MRSPRPLHLTRRGRAALLGLCLLLAGLLAALATPASHAGRVPEAPQTAVVYPGDTLWSVAARHVPSRDPYRIIHEIRLLNDLPDHTIHPGQELILP